ncbi:MAG: RagB/SusD family nutrient uptake outer membrane protein [Saprospiraceae bacterium]|nr:RagB/SusD family nutrient uptake outer membrane protein [Saprospiraceae bacterium]
MQKINTYISLVCLLALVAVACEDRFLDVAPTGSLGSAELSSKEGIEGALIGAYSMLLGRADPFSGATNWVWGSVRGGDANKGSDEGDAPFLNEVQTFAVQANNEALLWKYRVLYEGIARANATLRLLLVAQQNVSEADKIRIEAEARFLRGHYYFDLKKNFNNTPYVDEQWDEVTPIKNDQDLWPFIEADFQFAFDHLPEIQAAIGRANKWAAGIYLAKTYLYQNKFSAAKTLFDQAITKGVTASGTPYGLLPHYANNFRSTYDNSAESVFAVQAAAGTGSLSNANPAMILNFPMGGQDVPGGCCGFFAPSLDLANSFRTNAAGLPLPDPTYNEAAHALQMDLGLTPTDTFTLDAGNIDPRLDHSVGRRGIPYLDWGLHPGATWVRDPLYSGPYSPKKFSYFKEGIGIESDVSGWTRGYTSVNYTLIRFADVLLMAAEAEIELNNLETARDYINRVRSRAMNSPLAEAEANYVISIYPSFADQSEARSAVRMERKLELSGEGHRFYDLVRWGIAKEVLDAYLRHENQFLIPPFAGASFTAGKNEYLPIPQAEIDLQGVDVLRQNPGY